MKKPLWKEWSLPATASVFFKPVQQYRIAAGV